MFEKLKNWWQNYRATRNAKFDQSLVDEASRMVTIRQVKDGDYVYWGIFVGGELVRELISNETALDCLQEIREMYRKMHSRVKTITLN